MNRRWTLVVAGLALVSLASLDAQTPRNLVVAKVAPVFLRPDTTLVPLRVVPEGFRLRLVIEEGNWYQVEFEDPQFGRRIGYIQQQHIQRVVAPPAPLPEAVQATVSPASTTTPATRAAGAARQRSDSRVTVFVSAPLKNGFVDASKDVLDSVRDIRSRLAKVRQFMIVDRRDAATIVLTVLDRGVGAEAYGQRVRFSDLFGPEITNTPMVAETYWVASVLEVGEYRKPVLGTLTRESLAFSGGAWSYCADQVVKEVRTWAEANAEALSNARR